MNICALALVLLMDTSMSVNSADYALQRDGVRDAFLSPQLQQIIAREPGGIAVSVIEWASVPQVTVPWQHLRTVDQTVEFAGSVQSMNRSTAPWGYTALGDALVYAVNYLQQAPCEAERTIIDVSGDGESNQGMHVQPVRDQAQADGVIINGLPIQNDPSRDMEAYYLDHVITQGGFVIVADGFADFARAIRRKLVLEITAR